MRTHHLLPVVLLAALAAPLPAAEVVRLSEKNWDDFAPHGKEVDAILGDYVLRNDKITIVIANPVAGRHANLTVKEVAGCIIDMTGRGAKLTSGGNDQLSAYYPNAMRTPYRSMNAGVDGAVLLRVTDAPSQGESAWIEVVSDPDLEKQEQEEFNKPRAEKDKAKPLPAKPVVKTRYTLRDGDDFVLIETTFHNKGDDDVKFDLIDSMRADRTFDHGMDGDVNLFWAYDRWFGQAYGLVGHEAKIVPGTAAANRIPAALNYEVKGERSVTLEPGKTFKLTRRLFVGPHALAVRELVSRRADMDEVHGVVTLVEGEGAGGRPIALADVVIRKAGKLLSRGRTDAKGEVHFHLPAGKVELELYSVGRPSLKEIVELKMDAINGFTYRMDEPGYVVGSITDAQGKPTPAKVQFLAVQPKQKEGENGKNEKSKESTDTKIPDPFFFVDSGDFAVHNCIYTADGKFKQAILPGKYDVIISYGPEHDAFYRTIEVVAGKETLIDGKLNRTVDTKGWISTDYHSHSSPSGDNTSSQLGRVLNLLAEHIEFAPCTEHQRIDSYTPHLKRLSAEHLMATCTGIELTGTPLPLNHQNAFPLVHKPRTQDGGGPLIDYHPHVQIERLAMWDNKSEKVLQQNHPDIVRMFFDKDGDQKADAGLGVAPFMTCIEVHPPSGIFHGPMREFDGKSYPNTIFNWMQLLNKGHRIPGVVNTDAHYNFHGSGWLRNYVKSPTDDPAKIQTLDIVRETNKGHIVMTTGPFMEVTASDADFGRSEPPTVGPGDDLAVKKGRVELWVRVQCPNWFDINRVQVFVNGRADEKLNFTRKATTGKFADGTVKFEAVINVELKSDAHLIVAAAGEGLTLGAVMGPARGKDMPVAVSNPIFVDVDGGGFKANGDELDSPLPK